jgi:hypothetical protein
VVELVVAQDGNVVVDRLIGGDGHGGSVLGVVDGALNKVSGVDSEVASTGAHGLRNTTDSGIAEGGSGVCICAGCVGSGLLGVASVEFILKNVSDIAARSKA